MTNKKLLIYALLMVALLTFALYRYHAAQPPDQAQINRCNDLVDGMPEDTREEIQRSINTFLDCLAE